MRQLSNCPTCGESGRKRRRNVSRSTTTSVLLATTTLAVCMTHGSAFTSPVTRVSSPSSSSLWQVKVRDDASSKNTFNHTASTSDETKDDDPEAGWLSWMTRGRKRGVSDVRMREAEELGGVPRSDRYSSR